MNRLLTLLLALASIAAWPCWSQALEPEKADLIEKLNGAATDDSQRNDVKALRSSVITLLQARRYDAILELLAKTREGTYGRSIVYEAIINGRGRRSIEDLPFCADTFLFAASQLQQPMDDLTRRRVRTADIFIQQLANQLLILLHELTLVNDPRRLMLENDPRKWLTETLKAAESRSSPDEKEVLKRVVKRLETEGETRQVSKRETSPTPNVNSGGLRKAETPKFPPETNPSPSKRYIVLGAIAVLILGAWLLIRVARRKNARRTADSE